MNNGGSSVTGYVVKSSPGSKTCKTTGAKSCTIRGLRNGTNYSVKVRARSHVGLGAVSAQATVKPGVPLAPRGVRATAGNARATVSWTAPPNNGSAISKYIVKSVPGSKTCTKRATTCTVMGLRNGTHYRFDVTATNARGTGAASALSKSVTPHLRATLTITATNGSQTYGGAVPTISPEYSGFVDGNTPADLTKLPTCVPGTSSSSPVGTYTSSCSGAVDPKYTIIYVEGTTTVKPSTLTITATSGIQIFGGLLPIISAQYSGFVNGDIPAGLTSLPTCVPGTTGSSPVGSYSSSCSGALDPNYTIVYVDGTTTVDPATLTITATDGSQILGGLLATVSAQYSGFVNGNTPADLTTLPTCVPGTTSSSPVGTYTSSCSGAVDPNYIFDYVDGTTTVNGITVNPTLIITATNGSQTFGGLLPTISAQYSGFVNGDTPADLTTLPTCISGTTTSSPVLGSYTSSCSGAVDPNYTIVYVDGTTTVNQAPLTITATNGSQTFGGLLPTISAQYSGFVAGNAPADLTSLPSCVSGTTSSSPVSGTYLTSCSGAVDPNYTINYVGGIATVSPALLTITATNGSQTFGGLLPTISPQYSGFVAGNTSADLASLPTCIPGTTTSSPVLGSYTSSCSGAADPNYAINYVGGTTTVSPTLLTITATNGSQTFGGLLATISPQYSGFVAGDTPGDLTSLPSCVPGTTSSSPVLGDYLSSCSGADDSNYTINYIDGTTTVNPAPLTITASSGTQTFGGLLATISPQYSGFVDGNTSADLTSLPTCIPGTTTSSPVLGSYTSSCSGAADPNYAFTYVNGSTAVKPAILTITASSATQTFGGLLPTISPQYSGFVAGNTSADLASLPTCIPGTTSLSPVLGTYLSSCSGAADPNYTVDYVDGTTTVSPALLTITANPEVKLAGSPDPALTFVAVGLIGTNTTTGSLTRAPGEAPGVYAIEQGTLTAGPNYTIVFVGSVLTILL